MKHFKLPRPVDGAKAIIMTLACLLTPCTPAFAGGSYLAVWSSDKEANNRRQSPDFLAIIDADPRSSTYGTVVNTAALENVPNANLLNEIGLASGISSNVLNEAHHMTHDPVVISGRKYLFMAGLISANVFRCDVTNPLYIPTCPLITRSTQVKNFSGTDDFVLDPNGNLLVTYMGAKNLQTPGGVVKLSPTGRVLGEYPAAMAGGPKRYRPSVNGVTDTGLLAHPHGIDTRPDLDLMVTSDYADPLSLASSTTPVSETQDLGTTVRFWKLSKLAAGPTAISQLPVGRGLEKNPIQNSPEGVMSVGFTHVRMHKAAFAASMMGGSLFYTPDATVAHPKFREIYSVGPGAGASVFTITPDDRYIILPISGIQSPGDALFDRDYSGEHSRRVIALNIEKLLKAGVNAECDAPRRQLDADGFVNKVLGRNNGASDCPVETGTLNLDSQDNFDTHGGPHFLAVDHESRRVAIANYFVQLTPFGLPGTGSAGDDRVCMARLTHGGEVRLDAAFKDELTGQSCVAMDRPLSYYWPNRGNTGSAKPHGVAFINFDD
ncbi:MAG: selenium-binding protein SBP56-related protein [Burkholderiaceae bacterium]